MEQMTSADIRDYKKAMRDVCKRERKMMSPVLKNELDESVFERFVRNYEYRSNDLILAYVSTDIEVDTKRIIAKALSDGKTVAVPLCHPETREMDFYVIHSDDDLRTGHYGIREPDPFRCEKAVISGKALCIVPGLCFDRRGYRLGYGGGYYDRFLSTHKVTRVGICYSYFMVNELIYGKYDVRMDKVITNYPIERNECVE